MVEQNARRALAMSDRGYVLDVGKNAFEGKGDELLSDDKVAAALPRRHGAHATGRAGGRRAELKRPGRVAPAVSNFSCCVARQACGASTGSSSNTSILPSLKR